MQVRSLSLLASSIPHSDAFNDLRQESLDWIIGTTENTNTINFPTTSTTWEKRNDVLIEKIHEVRLIVNHLDNIDSSPDQGQVQIIQIVT